MRKPALFIALLLILMNQAIAQKQLVNTTAPPNFYKVRSEMLKQMKNADEIEATAGETDGLYAKFKRWEYFMNQRTYPSGNYFSPDALINEFNRYQANRKISLNVQNANWNAIGPFTPPTGFDSLLSPGIGRINCIALHPTDSNILFVGTACGGIWKTIDGGINWASSNDALPSMSITDISINPLNPDTIYAATGDAPGNFAADPNWNLFFPGGHYASGILMSTDGGQTWNQTGLTYAQAQTAVIYRVIVNPVQTNIVMAATAKGLYRSTDAGLNWAQIDTNIIYDLMLNPLDPSQAYAIAGRKLKRSFDYGATWLTFLYNLPAPASVARFAISVADTSVIMLAKSNGFVMKSINGGVNFTLASNVSAYGHQDGYDKPIAMSPVDANVVYVGLVPLIKSTNGGVNWTDISSFINTRPNYIHPDFHGLAIAPNNPNKVYAVNDGGVYVSNDTGFTWTSLNNGIGISQYYKVSSAYTSPYLILGGTQDNSTHRYDGTNWITVIGADGMDNGNDFTDENICYASWQFGGFLRSNNGGLSFGTSIRPPGLIANWVTPFAMNPLNSSNIYIGGEVVHNSYDNGNTWQVISPVIDNINLITVLETAPADSSIIVAASLGVMQKTIDHGANWTNIVTGLPIDTAGISDVAISDDAQTIWVSFSGFVDGYKIFKTTDGGLNWTNVSGTLPNVPFNCIEYQKGTTGDLYLGCDFGVFYKNDTMSDWISYNTGMPYVMVWDLDLNYGNGKLRAATYGRSMYETETFTPVQFIQNDAGVASIIQPFTDTYCDSLSTFIIATIRNYGVDTLTSVNINYQIDNGSIDSVVWTGSLPKLSSIVDTLAQVTFYAGTHTVNVYTSNPNNSADQFAGNDRKYTSLKIDTLIASFPVSQGFEMGGSPPENWSLSGSTNLWVHDTTVGAYGLSSSSIYANFFNVQTGIQNLNSPRIDLSTATAPAYLYFSHAYAQYDSTYIDTMAVSISNDCGITWNNIFLKWGTALTTTPQYFTNPYVPADTNWTTNIIDISPYIGQIIKVRFEAHSGYGNSFYLDDINIFHTAVAVEEYQLDNLTIKPNPSNGLFYLVDKSRIVKSYSIFNSEGQQIKQSNIGTDNVIDLRNYPNGLYFVRLTTDKNTVVKKLNLLK